MEWPLASLFAFATPLELLIVWGCLTILGVSPDLRGRWAVLRFLGVAVIAATASSLAALVYIDSQSLDLLSGQRIWRGWIIGDVLQMAVAIPVLRLFGWRVRSWVDRQFPDPPRQEVSYTRSVVIVVAVVTILVMLVTQGVSSMVSSLRIAEDATTLSGEPLLPRLRDPVCAGRRAVGGAGSGVERGKLRKRRALFVRDIAEFEKATALTDDVEQVAVLAGGGIGPFAGWTLGQLFQPDEHGTAWRIAGVADQPIAAFAPAIGEIVAAYRFGLARETVRQFGSVAGHHTASRSPMRATG